ncbi:Zn-dependent exopeptidase [Sphaerulina musiva SO2202]|uniref:Peptide hydrolase n=1 Tax=Sphaerulina musiva (strain SO2202) TaxID=692275 RepID=N1QE47_SPHMS|nr:Zn-dependent exopeptidase [Sphaerulina musiva SO2202]EMF10606.1 Zn-dependent exopeptidase [Sphaerulina musiva SO2202]
MKLSSVILAASSASAVSIPTFSDLYTGILQQTPFTSGEKYLIELSPSDRRWVSEDEKWALRRDGIRFFDVTDHQDAGVSTFTSKNKVTYPKKPAQNETVSELLKSLDQKNMRKHLETFTSFHTRYYKSDYGRQSSEWLFDQVNQTLSAAGPVGIVQYFKHPWGQNSIIATLPGKSEKTVVIGAHQDSINLFLPSILGAPGADDDGSGTVTILEALRVILQDDDIAHGRAKNTLEFHWYSAEEGGLLGSQAIFSAYEKQGRDVKAMLQQDMTGYTHGTKEAGEPESVGVITDFVDPALTEFIKKVVSTYCTIPYVETKCGYACSDHASASKAGYPSAFVIESDFQYSDKKIHTTEDKIDYLDFDHMLQHARLTLGLAYELAFAAFD